MDIVLRAGSELGMPLPALPMTPGREAAGRIDMMGPGVDPVWKNRRVVAYLGHERSGGYAELALAEVSSLHELPETLSESAAVAMIGTGRTTVGILEQAGLDADDVVLVTAAAGGIGTLLVQAAHNAGAAVIGQAGSADKAELARRQGARAGVDYSARGWQDDLRAALGTGDATVVFDGVGGRLGRSVAEFLEAGGRHLFYGWASEWGQFTTFTPEELADRGITTELAVGPKMYSRPGGVRALEEQALAAAVAGRLSPTVQTFELADAAAAHTALESRYHQGQGSAHSVNRMGQGAGEPLTWKRVADTNCASLHGACAGPSNAAGSDEVGLTPSLLVNRVGYLPVGVAEGHRGATAYVGDSRRGRTPGCHLHVCDVLDANPA